MRRRIAFTLVELLVVIGTIALLIAILLPALSKARRQSITVKCLSNLRQVGNAMAMYVPEYKGYCPGPCLRGQFIKYNQGSDSLSRYLAVYVNRPQPSAVTEINPVFMCPGVELDATHPYDYVIYVTVSNPPNNYAELFGYPAVDNTPMKTPQKITRVKNASEEPMLEELDLIKKAVKYPEAEWTYVPAAPPHGQRGKQSRRNLLYWDGHAATVDETP
jgi:prepilin-type processing-associated H-X9-DG protein